MRVGTKLNVKGHKFSFALITLTCAMLVIWTCNKVPTLSMHPREQLDILSPVHLRSSSSTTNDTSTDLSVVVKIEESIRLRSPEALKDLSNWKQSADDSLFVLKRMENNQSKETILSLSPTASSARSSLRDGVHKDLTNIPSVMNACSYAKGKWIKDNRRPLYSGSGCKQWLSAMWACRLMKRIDFSYEHFRWKPQGCDLPEFSGGKLLQRMQHKTIALVGDSLGRQQFQSLMCMITAGKTNPKVKDVGREFGFAKASGAIRPDGWAYRFPTTNTTILYHWSASLCEVEPLNFTDPATIYAMHLDRPATFLRKYLHKIDVLVLNTGHHWNRVKFATNRWKMYIGGKPNSNRKLAEMGNAKNLTLHRVVKWLDTQLLRHPRLKAYLRTLSPRHFMNGEWNTGGSCDNTVPLAGGSEVSREGSSDLVAKAAVKGTKVRLLDITALSQLRDEGHISRYSLKSSESRHDCLHWCLPGVPDTWNEILYAQLLADFSFKGMHKQQQCDNSIVNHTEDISQEARKCREEAMHIKNFLH